MTHSPGWTASLTGMPGLPPAVEGYPSEAAQAQRWAQAERSGADVQDTGAAVSIQPARRSGRVRGPRPAVVPAIPGAVAGRHRAGCQDAVVFPGKVGVHSLVDKLFAGI